MKSKVSNDSNLKFMSDFYKNYFHEGLFVPYILNELLRFIPKRDAIILDVGCGIAPYSRYFRRSGANYVIGVDISKPMSKIALKHIDAVLVCDITMGLPFGDAIFDVVYCSMVLEHLFDYMFPLREMHRVLKPGGRIIIEVPNVNYWPNRFLMFFGRNIIWIGVGKHIRAFNKHYLKEILTTTGFTKVKIIGSILPIPKTSLKLFLPWMNRFLPGLCFSLIGTGIRDTTND